MRRVRQRGTTPELAVRRTLRALGIGYSLHNNQLPGTPDIVNKREKWAIFVHGCYWHRHPGCKQATMPKTNRQFWERKFVANLERDRRKQDELRMSGYRVLVLWECETKNEGRLHTRIRELMHNMRVGVGNGFEVAEFAETLIAPRIIYEARPKGTIERVLRSQNEFGRYTSILTEIEKNTSLDSCDRYERAWLRQKRADVSIPETEKPVRSVDLFSGCGGMSLGVREACKLIRRPHVVSLAVDIDHDALEVMKSNFHPEVVLETDIRKLLSISGSLTRPSIKREWDKLKSTVDRGIDLLVAGPPCQGFSDLNNHTRRKDDRNDLYLYAARATSVLHPRAVLVENVPGVTFGNDERVRKTVRALRQLDYEVDTDVVDLSEIGVPQLRKRHVILATRGRKVSIKETISRYSVARKRSVRWAIEELQEAVEDGLLFRESMLSDENRRRIEYLFDHNLYDLPNSERPICHRNDDHSYKSMYGRLRWDDPAQTVTSGFGSPGQGRYIHPSRRRTLTAREAARLQFFPDYFDFSKARTRTSLAQMIGNAVPMKLSFVVTIELFVRGVLS